MTQPIAGLGGDDDEREQGIPDLRRAFILAEMERAGWVVTMTIQHPEYAFQQACVMERWPEDRVFPLEWAEVNA